MSFHSEMAYMKQIVGMRMKYHGTSCNCFEVPKAPHRPRRWQVDGLTQKKESAPPPKKSTIA